MLVFRNIVGTNEINAFMKSRDLKNENEKFLKIDISKKLSFEGNSTILGQYKAKIKELINRSSTNFF